MDLLMYIIFSIIYLMIIHFAMAIKKQFNLFLMIGIFILGGVIGQTAGSLETGFVGAVIFSFLFW